MKTLVTVLLTAFTCFPFGVLNAQNTNNKWQLGISFSPDCSYRRLNPAYENSSLDAVVSARNSNEIPKIGISAGLILRYMKSSQWSFESGFAWADRGFKTKYILVTTANNPDATSGFSGHSKFHFQFVEIPLRCIYTPSEKNTDFTMSGGLVNQISLDKYIVTIYDKEYGGPPKVKQDLANLSAYRTYNVSVFYSLGYSLPLNNKVKIQLEPNFRYQVYTLNSTNIETRLWGIGVQMGLYYQL